jgi:hypothetical protein
MLAFGVGPPPRPDRDGVASKQDRGRDRADRGAWVADDRGGRERRDRGERQQRHTRRGARAALAALERGDGLRGAHLGVAAIDLGAVDPFHPSVRLHDGDGDRQQRHDAQHDAAPRHSRWAAENAAAASSVSSRATRRLRSCATAATNRPATVTVTAGVAEVDRRVPPKAGKAVSQRAVALAVRADLVDPGCPVKRIDQCRERNGGRDERKC